MQMIRVVTLWLLVLISQVVLAEDFTPNHTVKIPMRDGTELPADIYLPKSFSPETKAPCILLRSPGGRQAASARTYLPLTHAGYTVVIQDTRSSVDATGSTLPYCTDGWGKEQDGYDTVEWLAKSPYTNGRIGTTGMSALGITQLLMAPSAPPSLKCQYISMAASSMYHDAIYPGGALLKNQVEGWLGLYAKAPEVLKFVCSQPHYNKFWERFDTALAAHQVRVPAIHYGGWYDIFVQGTINAFVSRHERGGEGAKDKQKLIIGPWTHFWPVHTKLGDFEMPDIAKTPPVDLSPKRWFDHYLKGIDNGIDREPAITYYVMGPLDGTPTSGNVWRHTDRWPVPSVETAFYLHGDKKLSDKQGDTGSLSYEHDSRNPVPTNGGGNLFLESGPKDQRLIEERKDVVVFTSDPLNQEMEITGRISAELYCSTNAPQMDVVVRLTDVYPDGRSILICDGVKHVTAPSQSKPAPVLVDLWSTSIAVAKGHRLRISVTNSNYPKCEKWAQEGAPEVTTHNLYFGESTPSRLILPVVRNSGKS